MIDKELSASYSISGESPHPPPRVYFGGSVVHRCPGRPLLYEENFSQAFPLMDDESVGRFVSTIIIAGFEGAVVATDDEVKNEHYLKSVRLSSGDWFPQLLVISDPTRYITITLMLVVICDYMITGG